MRFLVILALGLTAAGAAHAQYQGYQGYQGYQPPGLPKPAGPAPRGFNPYEPPHHAGLAPTPSTRPFGGAEPFKPFKPYKPFVGTNVDTAPSGLYPEQHPKKKKNPALGGF